MQVGEDGAVLEYHHARTHAHLLLLGLALGLFRILEHIGKAAHAHHRLTHQLGRLGGARGQGLVLHGVQHRGVDVLLFDFARRRLHGFTPEHHRQRQRDATEKQQRPFVALCEAAQTARRRCAARRRVLPR